MPVALVGGVVGFFISKKITSSKFNIYTNTAKAKATAIENEAKNVLHSASLKVVEIQKDAQKRYDDALELADKALENRDKETARREREFSAFQKGELEHIKIERSKADSKLLNIKRNEKSLENLKKEYHAKIDQAMKLAENCASLTKDEAKKIVLDKVQENSRGDIATMMKKIENEAKDRAKKGAAYILAQATSSYAGEFASERLVNIVKLEDDELKGRIIGKEGRNIKALETLLGVNIIIDETPNEILVSSFNLYRRTIATKTLELLIEDGRIQPARIEEIFAKVSDEFEDSILHEGENIVYEMGIHAMNPELIKLIGRLRYRASYGQNALAHTLEVANLAGLMAAELGGDPKKARRAGLLHDIGKALTHDQEGNHVDLGAEVCRKYGEGDIVINAIYAHHGHEEMNTVECAAVCAADALSAARPGARREVLESFLKRVEDIEDIASEHSGVKQAYAINAGREVRVIVNAELVNDSEALLLAREIATNIESRVQYPGEVKVNVIRESRAIEYAR